VERVLPLSGAHPDLALEPQHPLPSLGLCFLFSTFSFLLFSF
jgi:hypothetical protein